jgi:NifU-like protein involved in Fe-S cluster formation
VSSAPRYSELVERLFAQPARAGRLPPGPGWLHRAEAAALDRGAWVQFEARVVDGQVVAASFLAWGCPHLIAACALAAGQLEARPLAEAGGIRAATLARKVDLPPEKLGRLLVVEDALRLLAAAAGKAQ